MEDVPLLAVLVEDQRDVGRAVRVVFDLLNDARHVELVPLEVDDPVLPLVAPTPASNRHVTVMVASTAGTQGFGERLLRPLAGQHLIVENRPGSLAGSDRLEFLDSHDQPAS